MNNGHRTRFVKVALLATSITFSAPSARAEREGDFTYSIKDNAVAITKFTGKGGAVTIPDKIAGLPVKTIGKSAFGGTKGIVGIAIPSSVNIIEDAAFTFCEDLADITLPSSVTSIGLAPFGSCKSLKSITVDKANARYVTIDGVLFNKDKTQLIQYPGGKRGEYAIPAGTREIGVGAFSKCQYLAEVVIPTGITAINRNAFTDCQNLAKATIPASVTSTGDYVFFGCTNLTSVTIGAGVTRIGDGAFRGCEKLPSVTIPASVTSIGSRAFADCAKLTTVNLPANLTTIGDHAFNQCEGLTTIAIPPKVTTIGEFAFGRCRNLSAATFQGNAPVTMSDDGVFELTASAFTIRYYKGSTGFTKPEWKGYKTVEMEKTTGAQPSSK